MKVAVVFSVFACPRAKTQLAGSDCDSDSSRLVTEEATLTTAEASRAGLRGEIRAFGGSMTKVGVEQFAIAVRRPSPLAYGPLEAAAVLGPPAWRSALRKIVASFAPQE